MKNKRIIYISGAIILLGTLSYFGYKWYKKNKGGSAMVPPPSTTSIRPILNNGPKIDTTPVVVATSAGK